MSSHAPPSASTLGTLLQRISTEGSQLADLSLLVSGPTAHIRSFNCLHYDLAAYQATLELGVFEAVPLEGESESNGTERGNEEEEAGGKGGEREGGKAGIELGNLARVVGVDEDRLGRMLRLLVTRGIFLEVVPGRFAHSAASGLIQRDGM